MMAVRLRSNWNKPIWGHKRHAWRPRGGFMPFELHEAGAEAHRDDVRVLSSASLCSCEGYRVGLVNVSSRSRPRPTYKI
jgi:hypothetical protein